MSVRVLIVLIATCAAIGAPLRADLIVTLSPRDEDMNPVEGPVAVGALVFVDVLLSVDGTDNPLVDVRAIQLDFSASSPELARDTLTWTLDPGISDASYFQLMEPVPSVTYMGTQRVEGFILDLDATPTAVATMEVTVNGSGTLTVQSPSTEAPSSATILTAGFTAPSTFSSGDGNLAGGTFALSVEVDAPADSDGDGTTDELDAFPLDPDETTDTDQDGTGDAADEDDDNDGVSDNDDALPLDGTETTDTDQDGVGDNTDDDDDDDGVPDVDDAFPLDPDRSAEAGGGDSQPSGTGGGLCGLGMLSTSVFLAAGLAGLKPGAHRRRRRR